MPDRDVLERIGANVRAERARRRLTQEQLADRAGLAVTQVARMERGEVDSGVTKYVSIARALHMDVSDLFEGLAVEWDPRPADDPRG